MVRRFSESFGEEAGAHFTSRDIIYLMTDLLLSDADLSDAGNVTVYDMTMGTSQMLSCMEERIHELNPEIVVTCFGQEFNPSTFAIAKADMMIRGGDPNNMRFGDTLSDDKFSGYTFKYCISNPPFGIDWKREQKPLKRNTTTANSDALNRDCQKFLTDSNFLCLTVFQNFHQQAKWQLFRMARRSLQVTPEAVQVKFAATFWKMIGLILSFNLAPINL